MDTAHDALLDVGLVNSWHLVTKAQAAGVGPGVYLAHRTKTAALDWRASGWTVADVAHVSKARRFPVQDPADQDEMLLDAITWANARYGTTVWATIPGLPGDLFPAEVASWAAERVAASTAAA
ncbi:hypothetical protein [Cellulomonas sp. ICMP 17802]|uniref:hypothetical protein n=1 Tax=Cellulomonas sp. ICMP 17802 TaxID=3239199 RepID=UPI00351BD611